MPLSPCGRGQIAAYCLNGEGAPKPFSQNPFVIPVTDFHTPVSPFPLSLMSNRAGYQPLSQSIDEEADVGDISNQPGASADFGTRAGKANGRRRARPGSIDLGKLDHAFKRCVLV